MCKWCHHFGLALTSTVCVCDHEPRLIDTDGNILSESGSLCQWLGYSSRETPAFTELFDEADEALFGGILANRNHVLQMYLPERTLDSII